MAKAVAHDPGRRRWKRLRRIFHVLAIAITLLVAFFIVAVIRGEPLFRLLFNKVSHHALNQKGGRHAPLRPASHRKTQSAPSQVRLNSGESIRAAFYVTWDAASFPSLREHLPQLDLLFPEWLHVVTPDGRLQAVTAEDRLFDVVHNGAIRSVDDKVMPLLRQENAETEVFPLVNNFDPTLDQWLPSVAEVFNNPAARDLFRQQIAAFLSSDRYRGLTIDFESFPISAQPGYHVLIAQLYDDLHRNGQKLYISVPARDAGYDYADLATHSDGLILMQYDQHHNRGEAGPIAAQDWFVSNLREALNKIPREKLICALGSYGYDWALPNGRKAGTPQARSISAQEAWLTAGESGSTIDFHPDSFNPHFAYLEDNQRRHEVWFLDGVTALNQMRAAMLLGIDTFALWRLGPEDPSLWAVWDLPGEPSAPEKLRSVPPGHDVAPEGKGAIRRIAGQPAVGRRNLTLDAASGLITDESFNELPRPYAANQYGAKTKQVSRTRAVE
jgi:spore germination protein YaaH